MAKDMEIRQRKSMAMGKGDYTGNATSVPGPEGRVIPHPDRNMDTSKMMGESARAMPNPIPQGSTKMAKPAVADHGPHNSRPGPMRNSMGDA